jgi:hypothetical protein
MKRTNFHVPVAEPDVKDWGIPRNDRYWNCLNALMLLNGEIRRHGPIAKTVFPTATTNPTEEECYAAVASTLEEMADERADEIGDEEDDLTRFLRSLASCFDPNSKHKRLAEVRNRGKDVETDEHRDESIAWQVWRLEKTRGPKRAVAEVAALIGRSEKAVKDARKRVARRYSERGLPELETHLNFWRHKIF